MKKDTMIKHEIEGEIGGGKYESNRTIFGG